MEHHSQVDNFNMRKITHLILGYILLVKNFSSALHILNCTKDDPKILGYKYNCILSDSYNDTNPEDVIATLAEDIVLDTAEIVEIKSSRNFTFLLNDTDTFRRLPIVRDLSFSNVNRFSYSEKLKAKPAKRVKHELFDLSFLEIVKIPNAQLNNDEHTWIFPEELIFLDLSNNRYTEYDLQNNIYLEVVDFTNNSLTELPSFHRPLRFLRELHLSGNPLNKVTVEDIARLCALEKITLERTSFEASDPERYCECRKLKKWLGFLEHWMKNEHYRGQFTDTNFGGEINCNKNIDVVCQDVLGPKYTLKEAYKIREICLIGKIDPFENGIKFIPQHTDEDPFSMEGYDAREKHNSTKKNNVTENSL